MNVHYGSRIYWIKPLIPKSGHHRIYSYNSTPETCSNVARGEKMIIS